jgi:hypothetical protein
VTVKVTGATGATSAKRIAMAIANSPLVKTAVAGEDANWGRVVMAVGKAGEPAERDKLAICFGDIRVAVKGARDPNYDEARTSAYMKGDEITIRVDLGLGRGEATHVDLRPHQGLCGDQRRLPELNGRFTGGLPPLLGEPLNPAAPPARTALQHQPLTSCGYPDRVFAQAPSRGRRRPHRCGQSRPHHPAPRGQAAGGPVGISGGKMEPGERPEETLIRELHESSASP